MSAQITSKTVWQEVGKHLFAVLGTVTDKGEARTVGIVYILWDQNLYVATERTSWKARHIEQNPNVSMTVAIPKRIPFMPWIKIPAATITFQGEATVHAVEEISAEIQRALLRGVELDEDEVSQLCIIKVTPRGDFLTYGVGVPLRTMRNPEKSQGRVPV
jgi:uncharacterized pyridoxamine 5'-phosphate oxidase family protein